MPIFFRGALLLALTTLEVRWHARSEHSKGSAESYVNEYRSLLIRAPENASVLRGLGVATGNGRLSKIFAVLAQAVQIEPGSALNHHALAALLSAMDSIGAKDAHRGFSLEQEAEACIALDPHFADTYRLRASALARYGEFDRAGQTHAAGDRPEPAYGKLCARSGGH